MGANGESRYKLSRGAKEIQWKKMIFSTNGVGITRYPYA